MDFGTIKDIFTSILIESHLNDNNQGKELYKKFLKILKENEVLKSAFIVYKNLETKTIKSEIAANEYLKESISLLEKFRGEESITVKSKVLIDLLKENGVNLDNLKPKSLHQSIHSLLTTKKSVSTIDKIQESKENLIEWLMKEKEIISEDNSFVNKNIDPNKFLNLAVNKFNEKYSDLNEEEKNILKVLRENNEYSLKKLFVDLIQENIKLINYSLEGYKNNPTIKEKLLDTKDTIYRMAENSDGFSENILKLYELKNNLKND